MIIGDPSLVSAVVAPVRRSSTNRLLPLTYAACEPPGANFAYSKPPSSVAPSFLHSPLTFSSVQ
jgi:hypothetical protein